MLIDIELRHHTVVQGDVVEGPHLQCRVKYCAPNESEEAAVWSDWQTVPRTSETLETWEASHQW